MVLLASVCGLVARPSSCKAAGLLMGMTCGACDLPTAAAAVQGARHAGVRCLLHDVCAVLVGASSFFVLVLVHRQLLMQLCQSSGGAGASIILMAQGQLFERHFCPAHVLVLTTTPCVRLWQAVLHSPSRRPVDLPRTKSLNC